MFAAPTTYTDASLQALQILRSPENFHWVVVALFAFVVFAYFNEIEKRNWDVVLASLGAYAAEWFAEIVNALWLHFSERSALWTTPGKTSFLILVGINVEITFMFALAGLAFTKILPKDPRAKLWGVNARLLLVLGYAVLGVSAEVLLNRFGVLVWEYWWWGWPHIWSILLFAYAPFMAICFWLHDMKSRRWKVGIVSGLFAVDAIGFVVFAVGLRWI